MFSPFTGVFGTWVALMGMCQAGNLERPSVAPLSIVYTVYPYYNSDTLLDIWKAEEPLHIANDVNNALGRQSEGKEVRNSPVEGVHDGTSSSNDHELSRDDSNESAISRNEGTAAEITYWPPVQRGAAPKPRRTRTTVSQPLNLKS